MTETRATSAITHRRVIRMAIPVLLANATVPILGAVDTGVIGQLGEAAPIAGVGLGSVILASIFWMFGFLRMGTTGLAAQAKGAGDHGELAALLTRVLLFGLGIGAVFILIQPILYWAGLGLSPATPEVEEMARRYMAVRIWSAPAAIALFGITGWLLAQERARAHMAILSLMNGANILLDLWFVLGLGWGIEGVALATAISEWAGFALGIWFCRAAFRDPAWRAWGQVFHIERLVHMARVNRDIMIRTGTLLAIMVSFTFVAGSFGALAQASNQVLLQFVYITGFALDGFAFGAESLVGQAMGARQRAELRRAVRLTSFWGMITVAVLSLGFAVFGGWIIDVMTTAPDVREEARRFLPWMVAAPLIGGPAWMLDGVFIGATRSADMRNMMLVSGVIYAVALVALVPLLGNHGLWAALLISYVARGLSLWLRYPALEATVGA
ncbi:MAG: MATE family efflux transporter [Maritimibacter sp.]